MQLLLNNYDKGERQQSTKINKCTTTVQPIQNNKNVSTTFTRLPIYRETQLTLKLTGTRPITLKGDNEKLKSLSQYLIAKLLQL